MNRQTDKQTSFMVRFNRIKDEECVKFCTRTSRMGIRRSTLWQKPTRNFEVNVFLESVVLTLMKCKKIPTMFFCLDFVGGI